MDRTAIKALWIKHGGRQHGPVVEHYVIEQQAFYQFAAELVAAIRTPSRNDVLEEAAARDIIERLQWAHDRTYKEDVEALFRAVLQAGDPVAELNRLTSAYIPSARKDQEHG